MSGTSRRRLREPVGLVDDLLRLGSQSFLVPRPVVATELKIGSTGQDDTYVRLSATAIAAIGTAEFGGRQGRGHGTSWQWGQCGLCPWCENSLTRGRPPGSRNATHFAAGEIPEIDFSHFARL